MQPIYVTTPNGSLLEYYPASGTTRIISTDQPSDSKHPNRLNNNDANNNTKDNEAQSFIDDIVDFFSDLFN